ncbi:major facilitator superfamily domain-containing protein [Penicillium longicatenatum]|uniref:major facilitator superfamily domain-containing protein n=1 Tax=Penicillium longicatenatum TaxID=1561947 RepID=UPI00254909B1|nr:major facilitator superfamily domain-containing protein [Penicillium longicatenatum]KAJ5651428.1 major facilitator superfamily domain-containing protein [Penicillium longicatenatum]
MAFDLESQSQPTDETKFENVEAFKVGFESDDVTNPKNFSTLYKIWLVFQMSMLAMTGALGSSIISPGSTQIAEYTDTSVEVTSLTVALFVLGWAFGPMIWAPISEVYGRRLGMLPAIFVLGLFSIGTATSKNSETIFLTRFLGGIFASAPISNVPAALGDIFPPATRGNAMTFVALCITGGPTIGPIIGSALTVNRSLGWRWTEYIEAIIAFFLFTVCALCLPETYAPVLLKQKAQKLRKSTGDERYWHPHEKEKIDMHNAVAKHLARPLVYEPTLCLQEHRVNYVLDRMLCTEPMVTLLALYASFTYSLIYLTLEVFPIVFNEDRHWSLVTSALPFLSILVGVICAVVLNFANQPRYQRAVTANDGKAVPEARLPPIIVGGVLLSVGLFWFGWTAAPKYPWPSPVVAGGFIAAGFNIVFQQCLNFLVDTYGPFAASAVSANTILRSILACAMPIAARPMFENLGLGPAASLLGGISCLALPVPFLFMKYSEALRAKSKFTSGRDA